MLLEKLPFERLFFAILDRRRLFEVFAFFPLANYPFFFHHALEAFNGPLKILAVVQSNIGDSTSPPFLGNLFVYSTHNRVHVKQRHLEIPHRIDCLSRYTEFPVYMRTGCETRHADCTYTNTGLDKLSLGD